MNSIPDGPTESDQSPIPIQRILNVPNTLSGIRLAGSTVLVALALAGRDDWFLYSYVALIFTDWIDGKLAILLHQRTEFGARIDSLADAALYGALVFGMARLKGEFLIQNWPSIAVPAASYMLTSLAGLIKFGRVPSYHTYGAKVSAHLVAIAVVCVFAGWSDWPFHVAAIAVTATNLEATAITMLLDKPKVDVLSIFHLKGRADG